MTRVTLQRPDLTLVGTDVGAGPPVLLLHAGGERRAVWSPVARVLAGHGARALAYDQRRHGDSGHADSRTLPPFAADVVAMVRPLHTAPLVVGASLGGLAALLALEAPELAAAVAGLVLVDVVPGPRPDRAREYLRRTSGTLADDPLVDDILGRRATLRSIAASLELPALLVRGGPESALADDDERSLLELMPHARIARVERAGHLVARDAPAELAGLLLAELRREDVRGRRVSRR